MQCRWHVQNAIILQPRIKTCCIMTPPPWASVSFSTQHFCHIWRICLRRASRGVCACVCVGEWLCKTEQLKMCASHCRDTFPLTDLCPRPATAMSPHTHTQNQLCDPIHLCSHTAKSDSENLCLEELVLEKWQSWDNFMGTRGDKWGRM